LIKSFYRKITVLILIMGLITLTGACNNPTDRVTLNISAASSLQIALEEINQLFMQKKGNIEILANFAASGDLQMQIENGAPADVFISAAARQMDTLEDKELILPETRRNVLGNKIALIIPQAGSLHISGFECLLKEEIKKVAIGDPDFVPAGSYGRQALELLGIPYGELEPKLILGSNVMQVLRYVESGNVDAGILFISDTASSKLVEVIATAPDEINSKIIYPAAITASSKNVKTSQEYIDFLFGPEAGKIFTKNGFIILDN